MKGGSEAWRTLGEGERVMEGRSTHEWKGQTQEVEEWSRERIRTLWVRLRSRETGSVVG
jgi:hypothetical protein